MRKTINKIRQQPLYIREMAMWICVIAAVSLIGAFWFSSFQKSSYALLNPGKAEETDTTVAENEKEASPFAALLAAFGGIKSDLVNLVSKLEGEGELNKIEPKTLPLSN